MSWEPPARFAWAHGLDAPELELRVDGRALAQVKRLKVSGLSCVTLLGPSGSGKTSLAVALANGFIASTGEPAVFVPALDLSVAYQQHGLGKGEAPLVRMAIASPLLVLDDIGQESEPDRFEIERVIKARYDDALPSIITSSLESAGLEERYGAAVTRRLVDEMSGAMLITLRNRSGPDEIAREFVALCKSLWASGHRDEARVLWALALFTGREPLKLKQLATASEAIGDFAGAEPS